jgi:hypothetical protein
MRAASIFIAGFLLVQIALPVEYYACRQDRYDERFAWRMFSPERMTQCSPEFTMGEPKRRVVLGAEFHQAWVETAKRGRIEVITRMAEKLCELNPGEREKGGEARQDRAGEGPVIHPQS